MGEKIILFILLDAKQKPFYAEWEVLSPDALRARVFNPINTLTLREILLASLHEEEVFFRKIANQQIVNFSSYLTAEFYYDYIIPTQKDLHL